MGQISLSLPSDGTTIEAADVNTPFNTLLNEFNGNIDDNNVKVAANINGTKLLANSIPPTAYDANSRAGWNTGILPAPNTITALGNRSYSLVFNTTDLTGYISAGMRLRTTRTTAAPNQCTSLNGSSQYYNKTSPAGMTFTDDFTVSAWIKLTSYPTGVGTIISRYNGTSGWSFQVESTGQLTLVGWNAGAANFSRVISYQSVPQNKWVHVAAQLDMSAFTASTITSYSMMDGLDIPTQVTRGGTNPTALIQAGNLEIGSQNGGASFFPGKIAQVAIYNAKVTQATILASMHQTLVGTETALISAFSFNNTINDLNTTNANNLTAQGSAVATTADSPFGGQADGTISTTLDYGIVAKTAFSTNTTLTVQVPEGCTIPTSGGVSAVAYSEHKAPYQFVSDPAKWRIVTSNRQNNSTTSNATYGAFISGGHAITVPIGAWEIGHRAGYNNATTTSVYFNIHSSALTGLAAGPGADTSPLVVRVLASAASAYINSARVSTNVSLSVAATYIMYTLGATTGAGFDASVEPAELFAEFNLL